MVFCSSERTHTRVGGAGKSVCVVVHAPFCANVCARMCKNIIFHKSLGSNSEEREQSHRDRPRKIRHGYSPQLAHDSSWPWRRLC